MPKYNNKNIINKVNNYIKNCSLDNPEAYFNLTGLGTVQELEEKFKNHYNINHALSFSSATNALTAISLILDFKQNDEVIIPAYIYGSSIGGLLINKGLKLIVVDVDKNFNIDPDSAIKAINSKTRAIWACDFCGHPHEMYRIREICNKYGLKYISDAAQSFGASYKGFPASKLADIFVVSLTSGKTLNAGEGGMILTNDQLYYQKLLGFTHPYRMKIELGLNYDCEVTPINGRISPYSAIVANESFIPSLQRLSVKQAKYDNLIKLLNQFDYFEPISLLDNECLSTYFYFPVKLNRQIDLMIIKKILKKEGFYCYFDSLSFKPLNLYKNLFCHPIFLQEISNANNLYLNCINLSIGNFK